ncbi:hypothetical protein Q1695_002460 [Nippostrongylus brasiliensis]|nr:hypothetical protein Q1695_002460 [Nippostrongylus brasiliensis]
MVDINLEFPKFPKTFNDFAIKPETIQVSGPTWESSLTLQNTSQCGVLFKVKCTSNERIEIDECADILLPGNEIQVPFRKKTESHAKDELMVLYALVGKQWLSPSSSAYRCWERVKKQDVMTKRKIIKIVQK